MKQYEFIEHTADIIVRAFGATVAEAFANCGRGLFDLITGGGHIAANRRIEFEIEAIDREGLLVGFLSRLILLHEVQDEVYGRFEVSLTGENKLRAVAWGEAFDQDRHGAGMNVKAASYHMIEIHEADGDQPSHVQVLFDV